MMKIEGTGREVLAKSEWVAIATAGSQGPHVVGTWTDYINELGIKDDRLLIPVGGMHKTEANLRNDDRVELLCGTRQVLGTHGPGKGCSIVGRAQMLTTGEDFNAAKSKFPWARAVLAVIVDKIATQL